MVIIMEILSGKKQLFSRAVKPLNGSGYEGFTLMEMLIALSIVAIVFYSALFALSEMANNDQYLAEKTIASIVAANALTEVRAGLIPFSQEKMIENRSNMANKEWFWTVQAKSTFDKNVVELHILVKDSKDRIIYQLKGYKNVQT